MYYDSLENLYTGTSFDYYPDSVVHTAIELKDGQLDGITKIYFDNGQLEEIRSYSMGKMNGKWEKWNRQNVKVGEANYKDHLKDGKWFIWDDNGVLRYDMTYSEGKKTGTWFMYDEKGSLIDKKEY